MFKLGKLPARPDAVKFKFSTYVDSTKLPKIPRVIGHADLLPEDVGMFGNDEYGDCVWAGAAHETMLWNREAQRTVTFTDASVLSDYAKVTGFNSDDPSTDQGTDMSAAASFRRKTGVIDGNRVRHTVDAYLALEPGNMIQLAQALYLFGAVGVGIEFPSSAMDEFNEGKPWSVVPGAEIEGGHYVPLLSRDSKHWNVATWGKLQPVTDGFLKKYCDEAIAYVSTEMLIANKSLEGFDRATLLADLKAL